MCFIVIYFYLYFSLTQFYSDISRVASMELRVSMVTCLRLVHNLCIVSCIMWLIFVHVLYSQWDTSSALTMKGKLCSNLCVNEMYLILLLTLNLSSIKKCLWMR